MRGIIRAWVQTRYAWKLKPQYLLIRLHVPKSAFSTFLLADGASNGHQALTDIFLFDKNIIFNAQGTFCLFLKLTFSAPFSIKRKPWKYKYIHIINMDLSWANSGPTSCIFKMVLKKIEKRRGNNSNIRDQTPPPPHAYPWIRLKNLIVQLWTSTRVFYKVYRKVLYNFLNYELETSIQKFCHKQIEIIFRLDGTIRFHW